MWAAPRRVSCSIKAMMCCSTQSDERTEPAATRVTCRRLLLARGTCRIRAVSGTGFVRICLRSCRLRRSCAMLLRRFRRGCRNSNGRYLGVALVVVGRAGAGARPASTESRRPAAVGSGCCSLSGDSWSSRNGARRCENCRCRARRMPLGRHKGECCPRLLPATSSGCATRSCSMVPSRLGSSAGSGRCSCWRP
jgi:hypothetical protein